MNNGLFDIFKVLGANPSGAIFEEENIDNVDNVEKTVEAVETVETVEENNIDISNINFEELEVSSNSENATKQENVTENTESDEAQIVMNGNESKKSKTVKAKKPSKDDEILAKLKKFDNVEVKAFGTQIMILDKDQIAAISLKKIQSELIKMGFHEFTKEVVWQVISIKENKDEESKAILLAVCKFNAKG